MAEGWGVYRCRLEDAVAVISVDLGLHAGAPQPERPDLLNVLRRLRRPREDGLPQSEEREQLDEIEDQLRATLAEQLDAVSVGRIATSGRLESYFYLPAVDGALEAIQSVMSRFPEYGYVIHTLPDPEWSHYREVLYPDRREFQSIENVRVLYILHREGDTLRVPRAIDHYLYFPSEAARRTFSEGVQREGFSVTREMDHGEKRENPFGLLICRVDPVSPNAIDAVTLDLSDRAAALGGEYDGWETFVITKGAAEGSSRSSPELSS